MRFRDDLVVYRAIERLKDEWDVNAQLIFDECSGQLNESLLNNPAATVRTPRRLFQDVIRRASLNAPRYGRFRRSASILFNLSSSVFNCCMASFRALVSLASWTARERRET